MRVVSLLTPAAGFATGGVLSFGLYQACGASIDLFVTVLLIIALVAPLTVGWTDGTWLSASTVVGFTAGAMSSWFWLAHQGGILWTDAGRAGAVGFSFGMALSGIARLLSGGPIAGRFWPGVTALFGLGWISWPVWLSVPLAGQSLVRSVSIQPLFAVNSAVLILGNWVDQPLAYQLTSFGQDVLYKMPATVWVAVVFHGLIAIITWTLALWRARRSTRPAAPPPA